MSKRVILIEQPPAIWIDNGLFYVDFGVANGSNLAFRPSAWFATCAVSDQINREWRQSHFGNVTDFERPGEDAASG